MKKSIVLIPVPSLIKYSFVRSFSLYAYLSLSVSLSLVSLSLSLPVCLSVSLWSF